MSCCCFAAAFYCGPHAVLCLYIVVMEAIATADYRFPDITAVTAIVAAVCLRPTTINTVMSLIVVAYCCCLLPLVCEIVLDCHFCCQVFVSSNDKSATVFL